MRKYKKFTHIQVEPVNEENCKILKDYIPVEFIDDGCNRKILRFENPISGVSVDLVEEYGVICISELYNNEKLKNLDRADFRYERPVVD